MKNKQPFCQKLTARWQAFARWARAPIPVLCYGIAVLVWLGGSVLALGWDSTAQAQGRQAEQSLPVSAFELVNMEATQENQLFTLNDDPQMIWQNETGISVRNLRIAVQYEQSPREMCLYYTTELGAPFDQEKRVFATPSADGKSYAYTLPHGAVAALRLDPCSVKENLLMVAQITLNEPMPLWRYFVPAWDEIFTLLVVPGLWAAGLSILRKTWYILKNKGET